MPKPGDPLPLSMKLFDTNSLVYVKATVKDSFGNPLPGSPVVLGYVGQGKFENNSMTMPGGVDYVSATYEVFNDAGLTLHSNVYTDGTDVFPFEIPDSTILSLLNEIKTNILNINSSSPNNSSGMITGILEKVENLIGYVGGSETRGIVPDDVCEKESLYSKEDTIFSDEFLEMQSQLG